MMKKTGKTTELSQKVDVWSAIATSKMMDTQMTYQNFRRE